MLRWGIIPGCGGEGSDSIFISWTVIRGSDWQKLGALNGGSKVVEPQVTDQGAGHNSRDLSKANHGACRTAQVGFPAEASHLSQYLKRTLLFITSFCSIYVSHPSLLYASLCDSTQPLPALHTA